MPHDIFPSYTLLSAPSRTRSASGFTTRSDIGPGADQSESDMQAPSQQQVDAALRKQKREGDNDDTNLNETNYDEFSGYGGSLFNAGQYDDEDKEADNIYEAIDVRQDEKRKMHREKYESEQVEKFRKERFVHVHSDRPLPILHLGCAGGKPIPEVAQCCPPASFLLHQSVSVSGVLTTAQLYTSMTSSRFEGPRSSSSLQI